MVDELGLNHQSIKKIHQKDKVNMSHFNVNPKISNTVGDIREGFIRKTNAGAPNNSGVPFVNEYVAMMKERAMDNQLDATIKGFNQQFVLTAYSVAFQKASERLKTIIQAVDTVRGFYLVDVMLSQLTEDALAPRTGSEEIFRFSSKNTKVQDELNFLKEKLSLDQIIENITPDLCAYGEYVMETDIDKSKGLIGLYDNIDQGTVVSLTQNGEIEGYLSVDELSGVVKKRHVSDYVKFTLGGQRVKVNFDRTAEIIARQNPVLKSYAKKVPKFLRVGKSMIFPFIPKIKELEVLEKLVPATKLNKLSQGNLIGLPLPENYSLESGLEAARRVESMINKKVMVDPALGEITVEAILSTAGRNRVIPVFGDKGRLDKLDFKADEADDLFSNTKEMRDIILDSIGIPAEIIYKNDSGSGKIDLLKRYAKYLRKLKRIQRSLSEGLKQLAIIHLVNKSIDFDEKDIEVGFLNTLIEIDNLDRLEHADITLSMLTNAKNFFVELADDGSPFAHQVVLDKVSDYLESNLKTIGLSDALRTQAEGGPSSEKPVEVDPTVEIPSVDPADDDEPQEQPKNTNPDDPEKPTEEQKEKYPHIKYKLGEKGDTVYEKRKKFIRKVPKAWTK